MPRKRNAMALRRRLRKVRAAEQRKPTTLRQVHRTAMMMRTGLGTALRAGELDGKKPSRRRLEAAHAE
jgi:hypothetical protein